MRTRSGPVSPHGSAWSARCASSEAATASHADVNTAMSPSPVIFTTRPPAPSTESRRIASWRSIAPFIASGKRSQSRVLDSRSAKTKVSGSGVASLTGAPIIVAPPHRHKAPGRARCPGAADRPVAGRAGRWEALARGRAEPHGARDARAAEPAIAVRVLLEVLLVVRLGVVERPGLGELRRDLAVAAGGEPRLVRRARFLGRAPLLLARPVDGGAVLRAGIVALAHPLRRIVA